MPIRAVVAILGLTSKPTSTLCPLEESALAHRWHKSFPLWDTERWCGQIAALCEQGSAPLDVSTPAALSLSLEAAVRAAPDAAMASLIKSLATRAMSEAEYLSSGEHRSSFGMGFLCRGIAYNENTFPSLSPVLRVLWSQHPSSLSSMSWLCRLASRRPS